MAFVNCPVELLKVKLQTQYKPPAGAIPAAVGAIKPVSTIGRYTNVKNQNMIASMERRSTDIFVLPLPHCFLDSTLEFWMLASALSVNRA